MDFAPSAPGLPVMVSDLKSSRPSDIGLGCVTFGREIDAPSSFAMMDHALARGVTFFDTAAAYGSGSSETTVGDWLAANSGTRERLTLATKLLPPYTPERIETSLRASLQRLQVDRVDVLFLHQWHESALHSEVLLAFEQAVRAGRVGKLGVSNFTAGQLRQMLDLQARSGCTPVSALQNVHNFAVTGFDAPVRALCAERHVSMLGYSPLAAGFLTGKYRDGVEAGSRFAIIPGHQPIYFNDVARAQLARLETVSTQTGVPLPQLSLAWAIRGGIADVVLVGGRNAAQLDQAFAARDGVDPAILAQLKHG